MAVEGDSARLLHKQARKAMLAALETLGETHADARDEQLTHELRTGVLRQLALAMAEARGLAASEEELGASRLFADSAPFAACPRLTLAEAGLDPATMPLELLGNLYELVLAERVGRPHPGAPRTLTSGRQRKLSGTFFTPRALTAPIVASALSAVGPSADRLTACDPAVGGGAFLLELARALVERRPGASTAEQRLDMLRGLYGIDVSPLAIGVAELTLWLFVAERGLGFAEFARNLRVGDALVGEPCRTRAGVAGALEPGCRALDFPAELPEVFERGGFDLVIGNPPWVAYAGRAAAPLAPARKAYFAAEYRSLRGYPTLQALFVERAAQLAPRGIVALLVPSPIADLNGYRAVRRTLRATHEPLEPMLEFGQDAFESVTQPCFALLARPAGTRAPDKLLDAPFRLMERQRAAGSAAEVAPPAVLGRIAAGPSMPATLFGEMGFQTAAQVSKTLLKRAQTPDTRHSYPLLEGRDVHEYRVGPPRLFLEPNLEVLRAARCRLRALEDYRRVRFVVRQTARYPIAAVHDGTPFRNSLLAGFETDELPALLLVALLNSSLYRALHLGLYRDARQATFPQVKIAHLRALPRPPAGPQVRARLLALAERATRLGLDEPLRAELDLAVFELFEIVGSEQAEDFELSSVPRRWLPAGPGKR